MVKELNDMIRWWLKKGVDGFPFDAIAHIVKAKACLMPTIPSICRS